MDTDEIPLDDKARRMRDLLVSFYSPISSTSSNPFSKHDYLTNSKGAKINNGHR
ncbi:hypothetical protein JHK87_006543 [Glycine soja]|nr:hypothetical protein JHK87_006543 [Glycine soja]